MIHLSYMSEYIDKEFNIYDLENELVGLINMYDELTGKHLLIYAVDFSNPDLPISLNMDDLYTIKDVLRNDSSDKLSFYIETPGGSGEAAEEIAKLLRKKYGYVDFLIVGECKSAGTILAMCGDEICLNDTGSLGPIDAQIQIGRYQGSAHDYMRWVEDKMDEADRYGQLNNFDALMVAQITPGELVGVENGLKYGEELVVNFLKNYKFKNWKVTETTRKPVDDALREKRAQEIASKLSNHSLWKSHGRSLKIDTLRNELQLKIEDIGGDEEVCEIVERIQVLIRLIFSSSSAYKIIADKNAKLVKSAMEVSPVNMPNEPTVINIMVDCLNCGRQHELYINLSQNPQIDFEMQNQGKIPFPDDDMLQCECGEDLDLSEIRDNLYNANNINNE